MRNARVVLLALMVSAVVLQGQQPAKPGTFWSSEQIAAELEASTPRLGIVAGKSVTLSRGVVVRKRLEGPNNASVHSADVDQAEVDETTYILEGSGTFVTGGVPRDPTDRTSGIAGGESHDVKAGDAIVVPAGTPHWFSRVNGYVVMLEVRVPSERSRQQQAP
jgi:mannose-6-phosphate isomerase-like protein (cupin superfamily)